MNKTFVVTFSLITLIGAFLLLQNKQENFEAAGLVYNVPPEWFRKKKYDISDWFVIYYPEQLEQPSCMHYRGDARTLNIGSSAYRFWRM